MTKISRLRLTKILLNWLIKKCKYPMRMLSLPHYVATVLWKVTKNVTEVLQSAPTMKNVRYVLTNAHLWREMFHTVVTVYYRQSTNNARSAILKIVRR